MRCPKSTTVCLDGDPHDVDDDVEALLVAALVLVAPHAVLFVVPVGAGGAVHAAAADLGEGRGGVLGRVAVVGGPAEGGGVLDDGAVDGVLERRLVVGARRRLADERLEDRVLRMMLVCRKRSRCKGTCRSSGRRTYNYRLVPLGRRCVDVALCLANGGIAGLVGILVSAERQKDGRVDVRR